MARTCPGSFTKNLYGHWLIEVGWIPVSIAALLLSFACETKTETDPAKADLTLTSEIPVTIRQLITETELANGVRSFHLADTTPQIPKLYEVILGDSDSTFVFTNQLAASRHIRIRADSSWSSTAAVDKPFDGLQNARLAIIQRYAPAAFAAPTSVEAVSYGDSMIAAVTELIHERYSELDAQARRFLIEKSKQNIQSFLFYYAVSVQGLSPEDPGFAFAEAIDVNDPLNYLLPHNAVKRLEHEYLELHDSIRLNSFVAYLHRQVPNADLRWLYQSVYLRELLAGSSSVQARASPAEAIRVTSDLMLVDEDNPYRGIYRPTYASSLKVTEGAAAKDITLINERGDSVSLLSLAGIPLVLDFWATWCAPCLAEKPQVQRLATYAATEGRFEVISISVDEREKSWANYIQESAGQTIDNEYRAADVAAVRQAFNIHGIPRKMLLDSAAIIRVPDLNDLNPLQLEAALDRLADNDR